MSRRTWVLGGVLVACVVAGLGVAWQEWRESQPAPEPAPPPASTVKEKREIRMERVLFLSPGKLPSALPLVEAPGTNPDGYPKSYVDAGAFRALLLADRFEELAKYIGELQEAFEGDFRKERWMWELCEAFDNSSSALGPHLDNWVSRAPDAWAPYLARGTYRDAQAWGARGTKWAKNTADEDKSEMRKFAKLAVEDLDHAIAKRPRLVAAMAVKLRALLALGNGEDRKATIKAATDVCPECYFVRETYLNGERPRWGGNYGAMTAFAASLPVLKNPALSALAGQVEGDKAQIAAFNERYDQAIELATLAIRKGAAAPFLLDRARAYEKQNNYAAALKDIDAAIELTPASGAAYVERGIVKLSLGQLDEAFEDAIRGLHLDWTDERGRWFAGRLWDELGKRAEALAKAGSRREALRYYNLAESLYLDRDLQARKIAVIVAGRKGTPAEIEKQQAAVKSAPDDFFVRAELDYLLSDNGRYPEILVMWDDYLTRHPDDGFAYFERGGTLQRLGRPEDGKKDLNTACENGAHQGCRLLAALKGR